MMSGSAWGDSDLGQVICPQNRALISQGSGITVSHGKRIKLYNPYNITVSREQLDLTNFCSGKTHGALEPRRRGPMLVCGGLV